MIKTFDISWKTYLLPTIHAEGWRVVGIFAAITALLAMIWGPLGWIGLVLTVWCYYFFRDPQRVTPEVKDIVVSPADGTVQMIAKVEAPEELNMGKKKFTRVSIFMSVFNVHVNRMPTAGTILKKEYIAAGKFFNASLDKASKENERCNYLVKADSGSVYAVTQIAGLVARRIVPGVVDGQHLERIERFGLIRFGSRLDVYLPEGVEPAVKIGQTMVAGETILGRMA